MKASKEEKDVNLIIQALKKLDEISIYAKAPKQVGYAGQEHSRFSGDHYLSNIGLIGQTNLFRIAQRMPKGAHLHIHFNTNLPPIYLLGVAKKMRHMFISSDKPLVTPENLISCKIRFSIRSDAEAANDPKASSLFSEGYIHGKWMRYAQFLKQFDRYNSTITAEEWLSNKLVFSEEEAHDLNQTAEGSWEHFNTRTQMMKGLFNYETAYRSYTRACLQEFVNDNIQYAEIRVNFMTLNQVLLDNGSRRMENHEIVEMIQEEYETFQSASEGVFKGLKIIYCTPRSFKPEVVEIALAECLKFKLNYPNYIAGFDLVGEEAKGRPLKDFTAELLQFQRDCEKNNVDIPLLLHCGETLDVGIDVDRNLVDALLLGCKRISHGFALSRHPKIMEEMRARNICLESCPISNQILGLTPRVNGHTIYDVLANGVRCSISSDNGTLFKSTLSDDFYQVMVGKADMTVHGWRQLIEWSLEHSCMSEKERASTFSMWEAKWNNWLKWVIQEYSHVLVR